MPQPNRIAELRKAKKLTQQQLADKVGAHWITISRLERGVMRLTWDWVSRIADALEERPANLLPITDEHQISRKRSETVALSFYYASGKIETAATATRVSVLSAEDNSNDFWIQMKDDSLLPFFGELDLLRFTLVEFDYVEFVVGKLVLVRVDNEDLRLGTLVGLTRAQPDRESARRQMIKGSPQNEEPRAYLMPDIDLRLFNGTVQRGVRGEVAVLSTCYIHGPGHNIHIADPA